MPVILNIVTGLLGSGKTCVVKHLLEDAMPHEQPAVVVGEFAEEGLDARLLATENVPIRQLTSSGVGSAAKSYLEPLKELALSNRHNRIYLETSGVAEMHRILDDLLRDPALVKAMLIGPTATVVDAGGFALHHAHFGDQFWSQIDAADVIIINKVDRVSREAAGAIEAQVRERNPEARVVRSYMGQIRRGEINAPLPQDFTPRILTEVRESQVREFESFIYRTNDICYDRIRFGHLLLNLPNVHVARFKGQLKAYDKTHCVNGFPGQLDWDNTPVEGETSIAFIGLNLLEQQDGIVRLLDEELERQHYELLYS